MDHKTGIVNFLTQNIRLATEIDQLGQQPYQPGQGDKWITEGLKFLASGDNSFENACYTIGEKLLGEALTNSAANQASKLLGFIVAGIHPNLGLSLSLNKLKSELETIQKSITTLRNTPYELALDYLKEAYRYNN